MINMITHHFLLIGGSFNGLAVLEWGSWIWGRLVLEEDWFRFELSKVGKTLFDFRIPSIAESS